MPGVKPLREPLSNTGEFGALVEELSELAIVHVFSHSASEFSEAAFHGEQHRESREGTSRWGRLLFGYSSLGGARESDQPRVCHPERMSPAPGLPPGENETRLGSATR